LVLEVVVVLLAEVDVGLLVVLEVVDGFTEEELAVVVCLLVEELDV